jgi:hypothetical protein
MDEHELNDDETTVLDEQPGCLGDEGGEDSHLESAYEERTELADDQHSWPGDGSGEDDFQDFNQRESDDYLHEGE